MRPKHIPIFADILRVDPQTLADELHSVVTATEHEFTSEESRQAYADVLRALGRFQHDTAFPRAIEAIAGETFRPMRTIARCSVCQSDDVVRDASARWSSEEAHWEISGVYDDQTCQSCGAEGSSVVEYEPEAPVAEERVRVAPRSDHPDAGRTGSAVRPNHVRGGVYVRLDAGPREPKDRIALVGLDQLESRAHPALL